MAYKTRTAQRLVQANPSGTSAVLLYENATSVKKRIIVQAISLTNTTGSAATFSLHVGINGAAAADGNALVKALSVAANTTTFLATNTPFVTILEPGDKLWGTQGTTLAITVMVHGVVVESSAANAGLFI
jgi:hypothetical protein